MKFFLTTHVLTNTTRQVPVRPVKDTTILIPSFDDNCGFQSVTIKQNGSVEFSEKGTCMHAAVPVLYVGDSQSSTSGDMDLDPPVFVGDNFFAYRTRPFPDGKEASLVLLSGSMELAESGQLGSLPPNYRPHKPVVSVCSLDGDYVTITPEGEVLATILNGPRHISLDNVRFTTRDVEVVRARFPYRSSIHAFPIASDQLKLSPGLCDLLIPVTVVVDSKPLLTVLGFLESGHVVPLWDGEPTELENYFFMSSLLVSPACADILTPLGVCAMEDLKDDMGAICGKNLSTLAYADLVQDDYLKWTRRDREWRQLGYRPNRNIDK